jgi:hypothetical protein
MHPCTYLCGPSIILLVLQQLRILVILITRMTPTPSPV